MSAFLAYIVDFATYDMVSIAGLSWHFTCGRYTTCQPLVIAMMRLSDIRIDPENVLTIAAVTLTSVGCLLLTFQMGGTFLAILFHAICVGAAAFYFVTEPHRIRSLVRERTLILQDLAYRDGLTGLPNRRFFQWYVEQYLPRQTSRVAAGQQITSVILFDLNGFKSVNDTYGHDAGDQLLKHLADSLGSNLPADVLLARLGGDEFVAMVRDCENGKKLSSVLKTIRKSCKSPLIYQNQCVQVSASVGVASTLRRRPILGDLLREADTNMYDDKATQRRKKDTAPLCEILNVEM